MKRSVAAVTLALAVALAAAQETPTPTPTSTPQHVGPTPGTLGDSDVAGIPRGPAPTTAAGDSSDTSAITGSTPASQKPGAIIASSPSPASATNGSATGGTSASNSTTTTSDSKAPTPSPTPTSGASAFVTVGGSIATFAAVAIAYLL